MRSTPTVLSSPSPGLIGGLTGRSSNHRPGILDCPVNPPIKSGEGNDTSLTARIQPSLFSSVGTRFIFLKQSLVAVAAHPEHLLKEKIVWNLNYGAAVLADDDEHQINVDHPPAQILRQHVYSVAETEGAPKGDKKARRYIADHRPSREETNPDDGRGADQHRPKSANADAPDFQHQHRSNDPQHADQQAPGGQHGLVG